MGLWSKLRRGVGFASSERVETVRLRPEAERERRWRGGVSGAILTPIGPGAPTKPASLAAGRSPAGLSPHALRRRTVAGRQSASPAQRRAPSGGGRNRRGDAPRSGG